MNADLRYGCFYLLCSGAAFAYAVGHPYPPICIAKEIKPRNLRAQCFNPCYALQVADLILRHGMWPAKDPCKRGLGVDP